MAQPSTATSISPLLGTLPAELLNKIYTLVLESATPIEVTPDNIKSATALLQTCTQIRNEASNIFYTDNTFNLTVPVGTSAAPLKWLTTIGPKRAATLKGLNVRLTSSPALEQTLACLKKLEASPSRSTFDMLQRHFDLLRPYNTSAFDVVYSLLDAGVPRERIELEEQGSRVAEMHSWAQTVCYLEMSFRVAMKP